MGAVTVYAFTASCLRGVLEKLVTPKIRLGLATFRLEHSVLPSASPRRMLGAAIPLRLEHSVLPSLVP